MQPTVTIVGAGQAGMAMSRCLTERSIDHVLVERGEPANAWQTERWDSLRLLTPNWMTRLPGHQYAGSDPHGYMRASEVVDFLLGYARSFDAPILTSTTVQEVSSRDGGYSVRTDRGTWQTRVVVVATGAAGTPHVPTVAADLPRSISQLTPSEYRNPMQLSEGRVLVVGASASGVQIADELARAGKPVALAVGDHVRLPRTYRGMDIHWWLDTLGFLDERWDQVEDLARARRLPSLQLVGSPEQRTLDLNAATAIGVELFGRLVGVTGDTLQFSGSLPNMCASADLKQQRLLEAIDQYALANGLDDELTEPTRPKPTAVSAFHTEIQLSDVETVIWATGYRPNYPWLEQHLLDRKGAIRHDGGVMTQPGMYALGLPFGRRRKSTFLDGVGPDAHDLSEHIVGFLDLVSARNQRGLR